MTSFGGYRAPTCDCSSGPNLLLDLRRGATPIEGDGYQKVDLGGGVSGFQKINTAGTSQCTVKWQHQPLGNDTGETAIVDYTYYSGDASKDDPFGKAVKLAKTSSPGFRSRSCWLRPSGRGRKDSPDDVRRPP